MDAQIFVDSKKRIGRVYLLSQTDLFAVVCETGYATESPNKLHA
jgi:hypothetical protein